MAETTASATPKGKPKPVAIGAAGAESFKYELPRFEMPKFEIRGPKEGRGPKPEASGRGDARAFELRVSALVRLSAFDFRTLSRACP